MMAKSNCENKYIIQYSENNGSLQFGSRIIVSRPTTVCDDNVHFFA